MRQCEPWLVLLCEIEGSIQRRMRKKLGGNCISSDFLRAWTARVNGIIEAWEAIEFGVIGVDGTPPPPKHRRAPFKDSVSLYAQVPETLPAPGHCGCVLAICHWD